MRYAELVTFLWIASASAASAQAGELKLMSPSDVARSLFDAVSARRWKDAAALMDLAPLEQQRADQAVRGLDVAAPAWRMAHPAGRDLSAREQRRPTAITCEPPESTSGRKPPS